MILKLSPFHSDKVGYPVAFDRKGDALGVYKVLNFQKDLGKHLEHLGEHLGKHLGKHLEHL